MLRFLGGYKFNVEEALEHLEERKNMFEEWEFDWQLTSDDFLILHEANPNAFHKQDFYGRPVVIT